MIHSQYPPVMEAHSIHYSFYLKFDGVGDITVSTNCSSMPRKSFVVSDPSQYYHMDFECAMNEIPAITTVPSVPVEYYHAQPDFSYITSIASFTQHQPIQPLELLDIPFDPADATVTIQPVLPTGLVMNENCTISGIPTEVTAFTEYTIQVRTITQAVYTTTVSFVVQSTFSFFYSH